LNLNRGTFFVPIHAHYSTYFRRLVLGTVHTCSTVQNRTFKKKKDTQYFFSVYSNTLDSTVAELTVERRKTLVHGVHDDDASSSHSLLPVHTVHTKTDACSSQRLIDSTVK
jgi:hypothetical protein